MTTLKVKELILENFKGIKDKSVKFDDNSTLINGKNASGKTTLATAHYWLWCDRDYALKSNPKVLPNGLEEVNPTVTEIIELDGKEITVCKKQKTKYGEKNGVQTIASTNTYEINSVPYTERDFKGYFSDRGISVENILKLSHPQFFLSLKATDMRSELFSMVESIDDYAIAEKMGNPVLEDKLKDYTVDELVAMNKATIDKIRKNYGKDGELLRAKIEGLELAKKDKVVDLEDEERLRGLQDQLDKTNCLLDNLKVEQKELEASSMNTAEIKEQILDFEFSANKENRAKRNELEEAKAECDFRIQSAKSNLERTGSEIESRKSSLRILKTRIERLGEQWKEMKSSVLDEKELSCPVCGRPFEDGKIDEIKAQFEETKKATLAQYEADGKEAKKQYDTINEEIEKLQISRETMLAKLAIDEKEAKSLDEELNNLPKDVDVSTTDEYIALNKQLEEAQANSNRLNELFNVKQSYEAEVDSLKSEIAEIENKANVEAFNRDIDKEIDNLKDEQFKYEQALAQAQKELDAIKDFMKFKNQLVEDTVNKNFRIVKFKLFDYAKNGEYKDACIPTINGKTKGSDTNTALERLAEMDILSGLQKANKVSLPVFIDGAECFDTESTNKLNNDYQTVYLKVSDDEMEVING